MNVAHEHTGADAIQQAMDRLRHPLVWFEDGFFIVRDEKAPGLRYDFRCRSAMEALTWAADLASKSWTTKEHIEQFAALAHAMFKRGRE